MDPFEHGLRNAQRDVASFVAWTSLSEQQHARLVLEDVTNLINAQIPHFGDFRNGVMPLDVHRGLDLGWHSHCALLTPARLKGSMNTSSNLPSGYRTSGGKDSACNRSTNGLRCRKQSTVM